jgi:hypothetical protein
MESLLPAPSSAPRSTSADKPRTPSRSVHAPLLGFDFPLQRLQTEGARITRRFHSPARSVLGVSHPFDVLLRPSSGRACFIPSYAHGVHPIAAVSLRSFDRLETSSFPSALAPSARPPSFRTPELRSGSLSRAFSPSMVARASHPDSSPALRRATSGFPDDTLLTLRSFTPRKDRDVLGLFATRLAARCEGRDPCPPEVPDAPIHSPTSGRDLLLGCPSIVRKRHRRHPDLFEASHSLHTARLSLAIELFHQRQPSGTTHRHSAHTTSDEGNMTANTLVSFASLSALARSLEFQVFLPCHR